MFNFLWNICSQLQCGLDEEFVTPVRISPPTLSEPVPVKINAKKSQGEEPVKLPRDIKKKISVKKDSKHP